MSLARDSFHGNSSDMTPRGRSSLQANPVIVAFAALLIAFLRGGDPLNGILSASAHLRDGGTALAFVTRVYRGRPFVFVGRRSSSLVLKADSTAKIYELFTVRANYSRERFCKNGSRHLIADDRKTG